MIKQTKSIDKIEDTTKEDLGNWVDMVVNKIKDNIQSKGLIKTGKLLSSIEGKSNVDDTGLSVEISSVDYGKFLDEGTKYIQPRRFFKSEIESNIDELKVILNKHIKNKITEDD